MTDVNLFILLLIVTIASACCSNVVSHQQQIEILIVSSSEIQDAYDNDISVLSKYLNGNNAQVKILHNEDDLCALLEELFVGHLSNINTNNYIFFVDTMQQVSHILNQQCVFFNKINMYKYIVNEVDTKIIKLQYNHNDRKTLRRILSVNYTGWISASPLLPRQAIQSAVAYYNNSIFLLGGEPESSQIVEIAYDSQQQIFLITDHGRNTLKDGNDQAVNVYGSSQYYTQKNEMLYFIEGDSGNSIRRYNLADRIFDVNYQLTITNINNPGSYACLESTHEYLFIVGGGIATVTLSNLQIYNFSSDEWSEGPPMQTKRRWHSCAINEMTNSLYAIAGKRDSQYDYLNSIEKISLDDIMNQNWYYIDNLEHPTFNMRAVSYKDSILIIGGRNYQVGVGFAHLNEIQVINCTTDSISFAGYLNYQVYDTAAIYVSDMQMIFAFGGHDGTSFLNKWQYIHLPAAAPTVLPTQTPNVITPTSSPSDEMHGIYIDIEVKYDLDVNTTDVITTLVSSLVNETVEHECILSIINNATNNKQSNSTSIGVKIFVCDEESKVNLIAVFSNNLESDLITKINNNDEIQLKVSVNMIDVTLNGERIDDMFDNTKVITTEINYYGNVYGTKDNTFIYMMIAMGCMLILVFVGILFFLFWKHKHQKKMKDVNNILSTTCETTTATGVTTCDSNTGGEYMEGDDQTDVELNEGEVEEMYTSEINLTETPTTKGTPTMNGVPVVKGDEILTDCGDV